MGYVNGQMTGGLKLCPNCFASEYNGERCGNCGFEGSRDIRSSLALPRGVVLKGMYLVGRVLGEGGFGITYKVLDLRRRQIMAVKEYAPSGMAGRIRNTVQMGVVSRVKEKSYRRGLMRFLEEAQLLKSLGNIPGVVRITDGFRENGTAYFVMEYLEGMTLGQAAGAAGGRLPARELTDVIVQVGEALGVIHRQTGIIHRDISPENIFILKNGEVRLIDFGSAKKMVMEEEQDFSVVLKQGFAPLEQYSSRTPQGSYTDIYALAGTYYYTLTGNRIPTAMDRAGGAAYVPLKNLNLGISSRASDAVDAALTMDYRVRTQTMEQFVAGIRQDGAGRALRRPTEASMPLRPYVEVVNGPQAGARWEIRQDTELRIGRQPSECNLVLTGHPEISKVHCLIHFYSREGVFMIKDVSTNGTFALSDESGTSAVRLEKNQWYKLPQGSFVALAIRTCTIKLGAE